MGSGVEIHRWSRMTLMGPRFYFRVVDSLNHEKLLVSQKYKTVKQRNETANRFMRLLRCPMLEKSK